MIGEMGVFYAKSLVSIGKLMIAAASLVASPGFGAASPEATPVAAHEEDGEAGRDDADSAGEHAADTHASDTHADDHSDEPVPGDFHAQAEEHGGDSRAGEHGEAAEEAHGDAHGDPHGEPHAEAAHGEGHGEEHAGVLGPKVWGLPAVVWHLINFVILFGGIFYLARKAILVVVRSKRDATAKNIEEATRLRAEMKAKFDDYDARMKNIDERMNAIVADARTEAESEKSKMVAEATALSQRMREDAKQIADQEIARARRELQEEQIARAAELAEQLLKSNVNKDDQARLADEFVARVAAPGKEGRA